MKFPGRKNTETVKAPVLPSMQPMISREIHSLIGSTILCVHPDGRLGIGTLEEITEIGGFKIPVPILFDFFKGIREACLGKVFAYDEDMLEALNTLTPFQRIMVLISTPSTLYKCKHPSSDVYTLEDFKRVIEENEVRLIQSATQD
jgi:hypothetical protein